MYDGDLVLVIDEPIMLSGVDKNCPIVINIDEKMTALAEPVTKENIANLVSRTLVSLIGECSNAATCYHNKHISTEEQKERYASYVDILSIVNSFAIDFAKTGYIMNIPYRIAKYSKPYPYFMRYISEYYEGLYESMERNDSTYKFSKANSNMNKLAFFIEKFHNREIRWKRSEGFDYRLMIDEKIPVDNEKLEQINAIYKDFNKEIRYLSAFERKLHQYDKYKDELKAWDRESAINYYINWESVYEKFRKECDSVTKSKKELANMATLVCYEMHKSGSKKFLWAVASAGILENLEQTEVMLPVRDQEGKYEYLGKRYAVYSFKGE